MFKADQKFTLESGSQYTDDLIVKHDSDGDIIEIGIASIDGHFLDDLISVLTIIKENRD